MEIIPAILTIKPEEVADKLIKLQGLHLTPQIDFMDGEFVQTVSVKPEQLPIEIKSKSWEAHLMVNNPASFSARLYGFGCRRIYWHVEAFGKGESLPHKSSRVEHGLALKLETPIEAIEEHSKNIETVLLMSIAKIGVQGEKFDEKVYEKIEQVKKKYPRLPIAIDGGIKLEHLKNLAKLGVNRAVVGSAFWKFSDVKATLASFRQATL
jgi:ribulose-phosphate 3-epimerase